MLGRIDYCLTNQALPLRQRDQPVQTAANLQCALLITLKILVFHLFSQLANTSVKVCHNLPPFAFTLQHHTKKTYTLQEKSLS